jgi:hypothetical protein
VPHLLSLHDWRSSDTSIVPHGRDCAPSLSTPPPRWPGAAHEHTQHFRFLPPLLVLCILLVLHAPLSHREGPQLRHVHSPSLPHCLHADLPRRTSWNQSMIDRDAFWPPVLLLSGNAREVAGRMRRRQRVDHENGHRAVFPPDLKPLWPLRGLDHRPALRARREHGPRFRLRRRL